jgi:hypothetical protein
MKYGGRRCSARDSAHEREELFGIKAEDAGVVGSSSGGRAVCYACSLIDCRGSSMVQEDASLDSCRDDNCCPHSAEQRPIEYR